jgi:glucan phosphoethanolaminetransferase (alkaline phosphatase superfamily)
MNLNQVRDKSKWWSLICAAIFLVISSYMRWKFVFESGNAAGRLLLIALIAALLTFIFGILSVPRWQSVVAFAIVVYAAYWLSGPTYAIP